MDRGDVQCIIYNVQGVPLRLGVFARGCCNTGFYVVINFPSGEVLVIMVYL